MSNFKIGVVLILCAYVVAVACDTKNATAPTASAAASSSTTLAPKTNSSGPPPKAKPSSSSSEEDCEAEPEPISGTRGGKSLDLKDQDKYKHDGQTGPVADASKSNSTSGNSTTTTAAPATGGTSPSTIVSSLWISGIICALFASY